MPGANCSIFGCTTNRRNSKYAIFKIPSRNDEFDSKWRNELVNVVTKYRIMDKGLKNQIANRRIHICERHFAPDQLDYFPGRTMMKPGVIPTLNLPVKSFERKAKEERASSLSVIEKRSLIPESPPKSTHCYKTDKEFRQRIQHLKLSEWEIKEEKEYTHMFQNDKEHVIPKYEIYADSNLSFSMRIFGWKLPNEHKLYTGFERSFKNVTLSQLIARIKEFTVCPGLKPEMFDSNSGIRHCIPKAYNPSETTKDPLSQTVLYRSSNCEVLTEGPQCKHCLKLDKKEIKSLKRKRENLQVPAKLQAPISNTAPERIKLTLQNYRTENKQLKEQVAGLMDYIRASSVVVYTPIISNGNIPANAMVRTHATSNTNSNANSNAKTRPNSNDTENSNKIVKTNANAKLNERTSDHTNANSNANAIANIDANTNDRSNASAISDMNARTNVSSNDR